MFSPCRLLFSFQNLSPLSLLLLWTLHLKKCLEEKTDNIELWEKGPLYCAYLSFLWQARLGSSGCTALDDTPATVWISKVLRYLKKIEPNFFSKSVPLVNLYLIEDKWNLEDCYFCTHESTQILYLQVGFFSLSVYESRENSLWLHFILSYRNGDRIPCEFGLAQQ